MRIRNKLLLTLSLSFLCFTSVLFWSLANYSRINQFYRLAEDSQRLLRQFYQITIISGKIYYNLENYHTSLQELESLMNRNAKDLRDFLSFSARLGLSSTLLESIHQVEDTWEIIGYRFVSLDYWVSLILKEKQDSQYNDFYNLKRLLITRDMIPSEQRYMMTQAYLIQEGIVSDMDIMTLLMERITQGIYRESAAIQGRSVRITIALLAGSAVLLFALMIRIIQSIHKHLQMIGTDMAAVARGDSTLPSVKPPSDEIGSLYISLMKIMQRIQRNSEELSEANTELSESLRILQETQDHLVESEKIAALGNLVSGVAHEINTPLGTSITAASFAGGKLSALKDHLSRTPEETSRKLVEDLIKSLGLVQKGLQSSAGIVQKFKEISVEQYNLRKREFMFSAPAKAAMLYLKGSLRDMQVAADIDVPDNIFLVGDPEAMTQVFLLLMENSLVHGFAGPSEENRIYLKAEWQEEQLSITYADNGRGIPASRSHHIFEPFYTSDRTKGKGLGLSIVHNVIREVFHGTVSYKPREKGSLFLIELPR